jgi:anaerobic ribonucleoside-triphosphate reductase activating protein
MLKVASFDIVFQEIPGEVTLALNLSNCPCHCPGCHSPHLAEDIGEPLDAALLDDLIGRYKGLITCVAFMGGDAAPEEVAKWAEYVKKLKIKHYELKTAWYSGRQQSSIIDQSSINRQSSIVQSSIPFDYVKLGPYIESLGGLKSPTTNQRLYKRVGDEWIDITSSFWK